VNRFPIEAISHSIDYLSQLIGQADRVSLTPIKALSAALDIERGLLENRYFEVFASDSTEIRRILGLLAQGVAAHVERVHRAWQDSKRPPRSPADTSSAPSA
jgi:hypothetical protein